MRIILLFVGLFCISCSGVRKAKKLKSHIVKNNHQVWLGNSKDSIKINYTGCGGFLIENENSSIMIDPYFSNLSPLPFVPFKKLKTDTALIDRFFIENFSQKKDKEGKLKTILVAHSHYDHLADIPSIYARNCNQDSTQIIGSKSTHHILKAKNINCKYIVTKTSADSNYLFTNDRRIRILPIPSEHAPHFCGKKLISSKKVKKDFNKFPKKIRKLPEGENFNFLIDFLDDDGAITFRIFSNAGAGCDAKVGFPPKELLAEKAVDVLFVCVANYNQVDGYPNDLIEFIKPKHIILNHWENFFRPIEKLRNKPATVPGTKVKKFISILENDLTFSPKFTMPLPLTEMVFYY
ncbi:MAG: MBL fold metallo-hydrolase [Saprospiraceae bacterium]